jgi:hypothetical protein
VKPVINDQVVLSRAPEGPARGTHRAFAKSLSGQGHARDSIHRQVLFAACLSQWLKHNGVALRHITSDHPSRYLRHRARQVRSYGPCAANFSANPDVPLTMPERLFVDKQQIIHQFSGHVLKESWIDRSVVVQRDAGLPRDACQQIHHMHLMLERQKGHDVAVGNGIRVRIEFTAKRFQLEGSVSDHRFRVVPVEHDRIAHVPDGTRHARHTPIQPPQSH